jgi:hypothetical protein
MTWGEVVIAEGTRFERLLIASIRKALVAYSRVIRREIFRVLRHINFLNRH